MHILVFGSLLFLSVNLGRAVGNSSQKQNEADPDRLVQDVVDAHNSVRADAKLRPLKRNDRLVRAARVHAEDMAKHQKMTHDGSDGSTASQRVEKAGYNYRKTGENVARGQTTSSAVMKSWLESPPHKANILGAFEEIGVALARDDEGAPYWCVEFGTPWPRLDPAVAGPQVLEALNVERKKASKPLLKLDARLSRVAASEAALLAKENSLDNNRGDAVANSVRNAGYIFRRIAQLAASGQPTPSDLAAYLLQAEENRAMLLGDYSDVGIGVASSPRGAPYWILILARPLRAPR